MAKKRRTSIRTASGALQDRLLDRWKELRADPLRVLPACPGGDPKSVAKIRARIERMAAGKVGFLDRRDKGIVGAVANALPLADLGSVPRVADQKVAGKRRFYLQRGHVDRMATIGVQNHDDPRVLLLAWRPLAVQDELHFFAGSRLWCTGTVPAPPDAWWDDLAADTGVPFVPEDDGRGCGHDESRVVLTFPGGPSLSACAACAARAGGLNAALADRYAGPRVRQPVEVSVRLREGAVVPLPREQVASYRAGLVDERTLLAGAAQRWRAEGSAGRFILGDRTFPDQATFLDALDPQPWEREALAVMTRDGHVGPDPSLAGVLKAHQSRLRDGVAVLLDDPDAFLAHHARTGPRAVLRLAQEEADRRALLTRIPEPRTGPVGAWVDGFVRYALVHPGRPAVDRLHGDMTRKAAPPHHLYAFLGTLGDAGKALESDFTDDEKAAGRPWTGLARAVMGAEGEEYLAALRAYLAQTGTGETVA